MPSTRERKSAEPRRLDSLRRAHAEGAEGHTPRVEDYLEVIFELITEKGYARIIDIGDHLHVSSPTVTKMIQRLDESKLVAYERYRGVILTPQGEDVARMVRERHGVVTRFLKLLGLTEAHAHRVTEGIEHHLDPETVDRFRALVELARADPEWWARVADARAEPTREPASKGGEGT